LHFVGNAAWSDERVLAKVREMVLPEIERHGPIEAWIIDDHCIRKADGRCLVKSFYGAYANWTRDMGYTLTQTQHRVTKNLEHLDFTTTKTNQGIAVLGLVLADGGNN
jgi:SRSO17 transposase